MLMIFSFEINFFIDILMLDIQSLKHENLLLIIINVYFHRYSLFLLLSAHSYNLQSRDSFPCMLVLINLFSSHDSDLGIENPGSGSRNR